jgi:hypothetical protein
MPDVLQQPAIRNRVWLGDRFLSRDPVPIQITPRRFEAKTRTSNLAMRVDRPYLGAGLPNLRNRHDITLPWSTVQESGMLEHLDVLISKGQPFDLGLWKHVYDVFDGDGTTTAFYLQRRQLRANVTPPFDPPDYPTRVTAYDAPYGTVGASATEYTVVAKTSSNIDTGTPGTNEAWIESDGRTAGNLRITKIRLTPAPPDVSDSLVVAYMPLYSVVVDEESPRSYALAMVEPRAFRLIEFG